MPHNIINTRDSRQDEKEASIKKITKGKQIRGMTDPSLSSCAETRNYFIIVLTFPELI